MKKTMKSRILSGAMAGVLAMSLAVPAFASGSTTITGGYQPTTIEVDVPTTGTAQINPYGITVDYVAKTDSDAAISIVGEQIVSQPMLLVNNSTMKLDVSASVVGEPKGDFTFSATAPTAAETKKTGFVYLQLKEDTTLVEAKKAGESDEAIQGFKKRDVAQLFADWAAPYNAAKDVVVGTTAASQTKIIKLTPKGTSGYVAGNVGLVRLAGKVVETPREDWARADGFTAVVSFTFKPDTSIDATLDKNTLALSLGTASGTVQVTPPSGVTFASIAWTIDNSAVATLTNDTTATVTVTRTTTTGTATVSVVAVGDNGKTYTGTVAVTNS